MTTTTPTRSAPTHSGGPTMPRVLVSELVKLGGLRSSSVLLAVGAAFVLLLGPVQAVGQLVEDDPEPLTTPDLALSLVLQGVTSAVLVLGVLGVLSATSEFAHGSIRITFTAVPRRTALVWGKAAALAVATLPVVAVSAVVAFEAGRRLLAEAGYDLAWTDPGAARVVLSAAWYVVGWAVLGQSLGWLLRSAVGASFALLGLMYVLPLLTVLVPGGAADTVRSLLVSEVGTAMLRTDGSGPGLSPGVASLVWTAYVLLAVAGAAAVANRRDA